MPCFFCTSHLFQILPGLCILVPVFPSLFSLTFFPVSQIWAWLPHLFSFFPKQNSLLLGVLNSFLRCVRPLCHCWCPPFSAGHVAFLFICLPGLSLLVSALFHWPCSISIHLSPRSVTAGVRPFPLAMQHSTHLSPRSVTGGVRPFPLAMQHSTHFYSLVPQVCHCWCPPFSVGDATFYSFVSQVCHCWCPPFSVGDATFYSFVSQVCHWGCPPFSAGHVAFEFICLPGLSLLVSALSAVFICLPGLSLVVSVLFRWACSISIHLFPRSVVFTLSSSQLRLQSTLLTLPFPVMFGLAMRSRQRVTKLVNCAEPKPRPCNGNVDHGPCSHGSQFNFSS